MIKILKNHIFNNPNFIYVTTAFDLKLYDRLYENYNRPEHESWKFFLDQNNFKIFDKLQNKHKYQYRGKQKKVGYVFFKDRNDRRYSKVNFDNTFVEYLPNTILITSGDNIIEFSKTESPLPDRPFLVVELTKSFVESINKFF